MWKWRRGLKFSFSVSAFILLCAHSDKRKWGEREREKHIGGVADDACATMSVCRVALLVPYMCNVNDEWHITLARFKLYTHIHRNTHRD